MKRVTIDGSALPPLRPELPAQWLKIFVQTPDGSRSVGRAYTIRHVNWATNELDIDMFLHGDTGPISAWAERAVVGDRLEISNVHPRSGFPIEYEVKHYLLLADETGLPAVGAILAALPDHASAIVIAKIANPSEEIFFASAAKVVVKWIYRDVEFEQEAFEAVLAQTQIYSDAKVLVAAESSDVKGIRKVLAERGINRANVDASGYWKKGEANHKDDSE
ncbi:siderophore-interacting protein [Herbaspirillum sp. LeCh32-8]|uniref:siderophore-interacting protein n=1 Tax=Herbaspirillum sp. LeCh32-8 TaxID=2821356 RepID=UPI001AE37D92|nr:siderophore-interacting protein [Herbaspirillum sp. LeCh32-8]MBP0598871.1 siderophore-interacting protein [Herbaspirillum sp. LeCh32-8]